MLVPKVAEKGRCNCMMQVGTDTETSCSCSSIRCFSQVYFLDRKASSKVKSLPYLL